MLGYLPLENGLSPYEGGQAKAKAMATALGLYQRARLQARWSRLRSALGGRACFLFRLEKVNEACDIRGRCYAGARTVPLDLIRGSEARCNDFDRDFHPLQDHTRERWLGIAAACEMGTSMPPVELVQVRDTYFVRDGHHRISVAKALGRKDIEAEVTVWDADGSLPWRDPSPGRRPMTTSTLASQPA
jgi:hypothetical protein